MNFVRHFYEIVIRPFIEPFSGFFIEILVKIKIGFFLFLIMLTDAAVELLQVPAITETTLELVAMPAKYWVGLFILTLADMVFGSIRAAIEPEIEWDWKVFGRGAYKFIVYGGALVVSATATNMFPLIFGVFQYVIVAVLVAMELRSFFRNTKLLAVWRAALEVLSNNIKTGSSDFLDIVKRKDKELIIESHESKNTYKGEKGEKGEKGDKGEDFN